MGPLPFSLKQVCTPWGGAATAAAAAAAAGPLLGGQQPTHCRCVEHPIETRCYSFHMLLSIPALQYKTLIISGQAQNK